jgi:hypothetical protein
MPIALVLFWSLFTGTVAVCYLVILSRRPKWFPVLIAAQTVATVGFDWLTRAYIRPPQFRVPDPAFGLQFAGFGALACTMVSYAFFLFSIQRRGFSTFRHLQSFL